MTHASLFSGIGGFDLAAQWAGFDNIFQVEKDEFCQKVLSKNFPNTEKYKDIFDFKGDNYNGKIDVISGGFPCQPFSIAGKRKGSQDDRYLWDEMFRVITEVLPRWIIAENVGGLLTIEEGLVLEKCFADLESANYQTQTFIIPAVSKNAPHRRDRVWIVAQNTNGSRMCNGWEEQRQFGSTNEISSGSVQNFTDTDNLRELQQKGAKQNKREWINNCSEDTADTDSKRLQRRSRAKLYSKYHRGQSKHWEQNWYEVATQFCRVDDGIPNRVDRLKSLGNAIVPQVAYEIFMGIREVNDKLSKQSN